MYGNGGTITGERMEERKMFYFFKMIYECSSFPLTITQKSEIKKIVILTAGYASLSITKAS